MKINLIDFILGKFKSLKNDIKLLEKNKANNIDLEQLRGYNISSYEFLIAEGYPLELATYKENVEDGANFNKRYINIDKDISKVTTNTDIVLSFIYEKDGEKKIYQKFEKYSTDKFINTVQLPFIEGNPSIQISLYKNKQYNKNFEQIDSNKCSVLLNYEKKEADIIDEIDEVCFRISIRDRNVLTKDNTQEYIPTNDYEPATKKYVDDNKEYINYNDKLINDKITTLHISRNPVLCSTEINKKPLCELFPELLNMTYDTVFKKSISFKVNMDNFVKEYPTVKSAYNKIGVNLYDENDNFIGNSYGSYINGDGLNIVYINTTQNIRFSAYFDKALVEGSNTSMETKNGYMTIQLSIPKGDNKKEFIDKIKNLKLSIIVFKTDFLNLNNESIYTPTSDYNPATKKYVDDNILLEQLPILRMDETNKRIYVNCNNMGTYKKYFVPNKYANVYGFSFIYTNEDSSETEIALVGGAMTRDDFILCARNTDTLFTLILGGANKYTYTKSTKTLEKSLYGYLKIGNTQEYTPTNDYNPATKKYVDDKVSSLPQLSFNEAGELVVTINGVSKTFVPKG